MEQRYAIILGGIVANVIVADDAFVAAHYPGSPRIDQLNPTPGWHDEATGRVGFRVRTSLGVLQSGYVTLS